MHTLGILDSCFRGRDGVGKLSLYLPLSRMPQSTTQLEEKTSFEPLAKLACRMVTSNVFASRTLNADP